VLIAAAALAVVIVEFRLHSSSPGARRAPLRPPAPAVEGGGHSGMP
jgi:hypothetical protein